MKNEQRFYANMFNVPKELVQPKQMRFFSFRHRPLSSPSCWRFERRLRCSAGGSLNSPEFEVRLFINPVVTPK